MTHKEVARQLLQMAGLGNVRAAYELFIAPDFIHHNQYFKGDRNSLLTAMEKAHKSHPNKSIDVKFTYEDGDTVITHSLVKRQNPKLQDVAVMHIFRFKNDRVVELWDLGQEISKESPNEHGMF